MFEDIDVWQLLVISGFIAFALINTLRLYFSTSNSVVLAIAALVGLIGLFMVVELVRRVLRNIVVEANP